MSRDPSHSNTIVGLARMGAACRASALPWIKAKLDTGARSSALHAFDIEEFERDGEPWVRFSVRPWQRSDDDAVAVECPVHDRRAVRSSSGHTEERIVVLLEHRAGSAAP